jgi:hypothetical protein
MWSLFSFPAGRSTYKPSLENLEEWVLPAGGLSLNAATGVLTLRGTDANDRAAVTLLGDRVQATLASGSRVKKTFSRELVREIVFLGKGGNDRFLNGTDIRSRAVSAGNDYLHGGGDDLLAAAGNDTMVGEKQRGRGHFLDQRNSEPRGLRLLG